MRTGTIEERSRRPRCAAQFLHEYDGRFGESDKLLFPISPHQRD